MAAHILFARLVSLPTALWAQNPEAPRGYIGGDPPDGLVRSNSTLAAREVRCIHRATGIVVARTFSASDGTYRFDSLPLDEEFDVIGRDWTGVYEDVIQAPIKPHPY